MVEAKSVRSTGDLNFSRQGRVVERTVSSHTYECGHSKYFDILAVPTLVHCTYLTSAVPRSDYQLEYKVYEHIHFYSS